MLDERVVNYGYVIVHGFHSCLVLGGDATIHQRARAENDFPATRIPGNGSIGLDFDTGRSDHHGRLQNK
jgi:hypothetical protein